MRTWTTTTRNGWAVSVVEAKDGNGWVWVADAPGGSETVSAHGLAQSLDAGIRAALAASEAPVGAEAGVS